MRRTWVASAAYAFINDALYLEATVYTTLSAGAQNNLGTDPFGAPGLFSAAPYWRAAFEPHWGNHWLEVGTFGMYAPVRPWTMPGTLDDYDLSADRQLHRHRL